MLGNYMKALDNAVPRLKELILDKAAHDPDISRLDLLRLVSKAYQDKG